MQIGHMEHCTTAYVRKDMWVGRWILYIKGRIVKHECSSILRFRCVEAESLHAFSCLTEVHTYIMHGPKSIVLFGSFWTKVSLQKSMHSAHLECKVGWFFLTNVEALLLELEARPRKVGSKGIWVCSYFVMCSARLKVLHVGSVARVHRLCLQCPEKLRYLKLYF